MPIEATPTLIGALLSEPELSAFRVALGGPLIRPQYTFRSSPGVKPDTDRLTVSPGLPVIANSADHVGTRPASAAARLRPATSIGARLRSSVSSRVA